MTGLLLPIAAIRAVLSLTEIAPPPNTEFSTADRIIAAQHAIIPARTPGSYRMQQPLHAVETDVIRTWRSEDERLPGRGGEPHRLKAPEDRPPFPTQVEPRVSNREHGYWRWSPFGYRDAYIEHRAEQRRDWRLWYNSDDTRLRRDRLLSAHEKALRSGVLQLRSADYRRALTTLSMAAELNQGDPACRIHLMQAQVALGHYDEAARTLRRALELQPKLAFLDLGLAASFSSERDWDDCVNALAEFKAPARDQGQIRFLLGYLEYQRGRLDHAYRAFSTAARLSPQDNLTRRFLSLTRPARR